MQAFRYGRATIREMIKRFSPSPHYAIFPIDLLLTKAHINDASPEDISSFVSIISYSLFSMIICIPRLMFMRYVWEIRFIFHIFLPQVNSRAALDHEAGSLIHRKLYQHSMGSFLCFGGFTSYFFAKSGFYSQKIPSLAWSVVYLCQSQMPLILSEDRN